LVQLENIFILPGIPQLFNQMVEANIDKFTVRGSTIARNLVYTDFYEGEYSSKLKEIVSLHPNVSVGSYPTMDKTRGYSCYVSIEGKPEDIEKPTELIKIAINGRTTAMK
jgi:molybdopterin-biosynthesis enzyme MoeA-like protein